MLYRACTAVYIGHALCCLCFVLKDHLGKNPGPGHYSPEQHTEVNSVHSSAPTVSISHRHPEPSSQERKPAPGRSGCFAASTKLHFTSVMPAVPVGLGDKSCAKHCVTLGTHEMEDSVVCTSAAWQSLDGHTNCHSLSHQGDD